MKKLYVVAAIPLAVLAIGITGCGEGGTTTVVERVPAEAVPQESAPVESVAEGPPPDTVGLSLDLAEEELEAAGYRVDAENTDTTFGIWNPENYTVCSQDEPRGSIVHVLAQKYGC